MNYGQSSQPTNPSSEDAFFTTGAGVNSEYVGSTEPENNLDLNNSASNWNAAPMPGQTINQQAIFSEETPSIETVSPMQERAPELGQVVNLEMPPTQLPQDGTMPLGQTENAPAFVESNIKTTEKLESAGIREVDNIIGKLNRDGNIASFYDSARDMMEVNLKNSYGNQANWKGKAA